MRTRSRGLPTGFYTEHPIPDPPEITVPLFTHPQVPFCPFPEAKFPTLEYPIPPSEIEDRDEKRDLESGSLGLDIEMATDSDSDSNDGNGDSDSDGDDEKEIASWLERPQDAMNGYDTFCNTIREEGERGWLSGDEIDNIQGEYPQYQHNISENNIANMDGQSPQHQHKRSKARIANMGAQSLQQQHSTTENELAEALELRRQGRWTARYEPGEFEQPESWSSSDEEEESKPRCKPEGYNILLGWTALHPGVKLVIMTEVVSVYGIKDAPKMLHLTNDEINHYVDLQESEAAGKVYEEARTKEFNDFRFKQMLAGRLDKEDSMEYIDEQIANGSVWESATLKMSRHDLRAGGRFLAGIGLSHIYPSLEQYWGVDIGDVYVYEARAQPTEQEEDALPSAPAESPSRPQRNPKNIKAKPEPAPPEFEEIEVDPSKRWMPMAKRNLFLDKVKKPPKKTKPLHKKRLSNAKGADALALTPSKLRMAISIDDVSPTETSPVRVAPAPGRARVVRQLSRGEDPAKSLEREVRKSVRYVKPSRKWAEMDHRPRKGSKEHHMREQLSRIATTSQPKSFDPTRAGSDKTRTPTAPSQHKTHAAKFACPELQMKWSKKSSVEKPTSSRGALTPPSKISPPIGFDKPVPCSLPRKALPKILTEETPGARKRSLSQDLSRPLDASTVARANKRQKNMAGKPTAVFGNKNTKEQDLETRRMSFEIRKAGDDARMKQPPMGMGSMEQNNGEARRLSREGTRSGIEGRDKAYMIPTALMVDEDDVDL